MTWQALPQPIQDLAAHTLTPLEYHALRYELDGYGIVRTALMLETTDSHVRHLRLSAWAKMGKQLVTKELEAA